MGSSIYATIAESYITCIKMDFGYYVNYLYYNKGDKEYKHVIRWED